MIVVIFSHYTEWTAGIIAQSTRMMGVFFVLVDWWNELYFFAAVQRSKLDADERGKRGEKVTACPQGLETVHEFQPRIHEYIWPAKVFPCSGTLRIRAFVNLFVDGLPRRKQQLVQRLYQARQLREIPKICVNLRLNCWECTVENSLLWIF